MEITCLKPSEISFPVMYQSLKLLADIAAIRLDENSGGIENVLYSSLMDGTVAVTSSKYTSREVSDPLASSSWEEVIYGGHWWFSFIL